MLATAEAIFTLKYIFKKNYNKGSFTRFEGFAEAETTQRRIGSIRVMYSKNFRSIILFNLILQLFSMIPIVRKLSVQLK